jgi:hypothetical protein
MMLLRDNEQRAKSAIALIWLVLVIKIISLLSSYFEYELLHTIANGGEISDQDVNDNDTRETIIGFIYLIVYLTSTVTFIMWFRRAYFNLHMRVNHLTFSEGWAAGSWFVPIINLFRPYQIMKELYGETKEILVKKGIVVPSNFTTNILGLWWTLWIINNIFGNIVFRYSKNATTIEHLINSSIASMVSDFIGIPLSLLAIKVIKDYAKVEPLLLEIRE